MILWTVAGLMIHVPLEKYLFYCFRFDFYLNSFIRSPPFSYCSLSHLLSNEMQDAPAYRWEKADRKKTEISSGGNFTQKNKKGNRTN